MIKTYLISHYVDPHAQTIYLSLIHKLTDVSTTTMRKVPTRKQAFLRALINILPTGNSSARNLGPTSQRFINSAHSPAFVVWQPSFTETQTAVDSKKKLLNNCFSSGIATGGFPPPTLPALVCISQLDGPEGSIRQLLHAKCHLSMTCLSVEDDNPSGCSSLTSKRAICFTQKALKSRRSARSHLCSAFPAQSWRRSRGVHVCGPQFLYATQNVLDRAPKVAPMSFNNRGEDRIALIYCLIKIQPLPSP